MTGDDALNADYNDPFQPPAGVRQVVCLHCGEEYPSSQIRWSRKADLWVCKNYERCGGAGYGVDIHDVPSAPASRVAGELPGASDG